MPDRSIDIGVELGGTKVIVGSSFGGAILHRRTRIPTDDAADTLTAIRTAIGDAADGHRIARLGIGSFGPLDLRTVSNSFGRIVATPKPGWSDVDVLGGCSGDLDVPVVLDTDVGASLVGERRHGSLRAETGAYLTVGTGIGGAIWDGSGIVHGMNHAEMGHLRIPRMPGDVFDGLCPFHGDCLEGLASGPALAMRFGAPLEDLDVEGQVLARDVAAFYVANGIVSLCAVVPVAEVVVGGGVAKLPGFHDEVARRIEILAAGYPPVPFAETPPSVMAPGLGDDAGVIGAIELGRSV